MKRRKRTNAPRIQSGATPHKKYLKGNGRKKQKRAREKEPPRTEEKEIRKLGKKKRKISEDSPNTIRRGRPALTVEVPKAKPTGKREKTESPGEKRIARRHAPWLAIIHRTWVRCRPLHTEIRAE